MTLAADLSTKTLGLTGAVDLAAAVLRHLESMKREDLLIPNSPLVLRTVAPRRGARIPLRPLNSELFIDDSAEYVASVTDFLQLIRKLQQTNGKLDQKRLKQVKEERLIGRSLYTTVQALGAGMDVLLTSNQSRKNFGMRFEEVVESLFADLGLGQAPLNLALPYKVAPTGEAMFRNQVDLVISPTPPISSRSDFLDPDEVVVSIKTSSKDRFAKIFLDKEVLRAVTGQDIPVLALFHNDVQRSGANRVSVTFVAGNFNAYVETFGPLNGVYYIDPPPHINRYPWSRHLKTFEDLLLSDLWKIVFR
ncbi:MAG TPA: hypothetical protein VFE22_03465 [Edaphobacter sp.]|nr:hypothetical protein [Edaphobacter sp.]